MKYTGRAAFCPHFQHMDDLFAPPPPPPPPQLLKLFKENYIQFANMNLWDNFFFYILTYEGLLINEVGKFIYEILSVKRNAAIYMWHILTGRML